MVPSLAGKISVRAPDAASLPGKGAGALPGGAGSAPVTVVPSLAGKVTVVGGWPPSPATANAAPPPTRSATAIEMMATSHRHVTDASMIATHSRAAD